MADVIGDDAGWEAVQAALSPPQPSPIIEHGTLGWVNYQGAGLPTHVVPTWDIRGHALGENEQCCACGPRWDEDNHILVHRAFDDRERYEYGGAQYN